MTYKASEVNARLLLKEQELESPLKKNPTGNRERTVNHTKNNPNSILEPELL